MQNPNENTHTSSYKSLLKANGLFGAMELMRLSIRFGINKIASFYLGVSGIGLLGLIENTIQLIGSFTQLGITFTGVRAISAVEKNERKNSINKVVLFSTLTGVIAALISIVFSKQLSLLTFGNEEYTYWFIALCISFISNGYVLGRNIVYEGTLQLRKLAIITTVVNTLHIGTAWISYGLFPKNGILIALICNSIFSAVTYILFEKTQIKINIKETSIDWKFIRSLASNGIYFALSISVTLGCFFIIRNYLSLHHGIQSVGYFNVGYILLESYLGFIFLSMSKFFFPKLTQTHSSKKNTTPIINQQLEIALLLITPAIFFIYFAHDYIIKWLFSEEFYAVFLILLTGLPSLIFKSYNYSVGYLLLSDGRMKTFFWFNFASAIFHALSCILLYPIVGLYGIGISIFLQHFLYAVALQFYVKKSFHFNLYTQNKIFIALITLCSIGTIASYFQTNVFYTKLISFLLFLVFLCNSLLKIRSFLSKKTTH